MKITTTTLETEKRKTQTIPKPVPKKESPSIKTFAAALDESLKEVNS